MATFLHLNGSKGGALVALVCLGVGAQFLACGSDVEESPKGSSQSTSSSGGGGSGGEGPPTVNASSSQASSSSGNPMTSSSSGPGDACDMACAKATDCGFDFCAQLRMFGLPLDCGLMQAECAAGCINDADCAAILSLQGGLGNADPVLAGCVQTCLGIGSGGAGGGGGGAPSCQDCGQNNCIGEAFPCVQDAECGDWLQCIGGCADPACADACDAQFANAAPLYEPLYTCLCNGCSNECSALDPCNTGTGGSGMGGAGGSGMGGGNVGGMGQGGAGGN